VAPTKPDLHYPVDKNCQHKELVSVPLNIENIPAVAHIIRTRKQALQVVVVLKIVVFNNLNPPVYGSYDISMFVHELIQYLFVKYYHLSTKTQQLHKL